MDTGGGPFFMKKAELDKGEGEVYHEQEELKYHEAFIG
jgi:hypothetical protein